MQSVKRLMLSSSGVSDCYGSLDERNVLGWSARAQVGFNFLCRDNQSTKLLNSHLCNTPRCLNGYDKILCRHMLSPITGQRQRCDGTIASATDLYPDVHCYNRTCVPRGRCDDICDCVDCEDEFYCLTGRYYSSYRLYTVYSRHIQKIQLPDYPRIAPIINASQTGIVCTTRDISKNLKDIMLLVGRGNAIVHRQIAAHVFDEQMAAREHSFEAWVCNRGVTVREGNHYRCLCPPSFYGRWCQYMSDRLSIIIRFADLTQSLTYSVKILATLSFTENGSIVSEHEFHVTLRTSENSQEKWRKSRFYLMYPLQRRLSGEQNIYQVRFEAYPLSSTGTLSNAIAVWQYPVKFDFLPVQRIAKVLRYRTVKTADEFIHQNICLNGGRCHVLMNRNETWCECPSGTYGLQCQFKDQSCSQ